MRSTILLSTCNRVVRVVTLGKLAEHIAMKYDRHSNNLSPTPTDYAAGRHQAWECAAHEAANEFFKTTGTPWTYPERVQFIDKWLSSHSFDERHAIRSCGVCADIIADSLLTGECIYSVPASLRRTLEELKARVANRGWLNQRNAQRD